MKKYIVISLALLLSITAAQAQVKLGQDTIQCHIVGFHVGVMAPSSALSNATLDGASAEGTMADLYKSPWLNFGLSGDYKYQNGWVASVLLDLWFGDDNLKDRYERMPNVFSDDALPIVIGANGTDAVVTCYNRGLSAQAGIGKIFRVMPKNPNSGVMLRAAAGLMQQQTIFMINQENAPQVDGDYGLLYDHQRRGLLLTEGVGFWFMSNRENLVNFHISFEVSQCWNHSTRDYVLDEKMNLHGPDNTRYCDWIYSLKFTWMFPLKGKTAYDYYYY